MLVNQYLRTGGGYAICLRLQKKASAGNWRRLLLRVQVAVGLQLAAISAVAVNDCEITEDKVRADGL